jgi:outer membrane protein OmpA-like peptidoglycan-associated protein
MTLARGLLPSLAAMSFACASGPPPIAEEVRSDYTQAASDPDVAEYAALQLDNADKAVRRLEATRRNEKEDVSHYTYLAKQRIEIARAAGEAGDAEAEIEKLGEQRDELRLQARTNDVDRARAETDFARAKTDSAEERARDLEDRIDELNAKQTERGLVMTMSDVLFASNSAQLLPGSNRGLGEIADLLNEYPDRNVAIEGHTDAIGSDSYNRELSQQRADSVAAFLRGRGVASSRLTVSGLGESMPLASNDEDAGRQANRRVEIVLAPEAGSGGAPSVGAGPR